MLPVLIGTQDKQMGEIHCIVYPHCQVWISCPAALSFEVHADVL